MKTHKFHKIDIQEFSLTKIAYDNPYDYSIYHRHDYFEIFLFENGFGGIQNIDFVSYKIPSKSLYFVTPGQVHLLNRKEGETGYLIQFTKSFLEYCLHPSQENIEFFMRQNPEFILNDTRFNNLKNEIEKLKRISTSTSPFQHLKIKHQFAFIIFEITEWLQPKSNLITTNKLTSEFLTLVKKEVHQNRSVSNYAQKLKTSVNTLGRETKKSLGITPLNIIHKQLILEIKRVLIFENKTHSELAHLFYFDDLSTYSRFIKKQTGLSPTELKLDLMKMVKG